MPGLPPPPRRQRLTEALAEIIRARGLEPLLLEGQARTTSEHTPQQRARELLAGLAPGRSLAGSLGELDERAQLEVAIVYLGMEPRPAGSHSGDTAWLLALRALARTALTECEPGFVDAGAAGPDLYHQALLELSAAPLSVTELLDLAPARSTDRPPPTLVVPGDARSLMRRVGLVLGVLVGGLVSLVASSMIPVAIGTLGGAIAGHLLGRRVPVPRCGAAGCGALIIEEVATCPRCEAQVIGTIQTHAASHRPQYERTQ